jgi:hypothetical protein
VTNSPVPILFAATLNGYHITRVRIFCEKRSRAAGSGPAVKWRHVTVWNAVLRSRAIIPPTAVEPGMKLKQQSLSLIFQ